MLDPDPYRPWRPRPVCPATGPTTREIVAAIVAAGRHGERNHRLRHKSSRFSVRRVCVPAQRLVGEERPAPGELLAAHTVVIHEPISKRFLLGDHDIAAFAADGELSVVHDLYEELVRAGFV